MKKLLIIHGWTYTIEPWTRTVAALRRAGIVVEQLRVPGLTEPSDKAWTIEEYVDWLHGVLQGRTDVVVLGHSNGGRIALHYLVKYPNAFRQLILLNAAGLYYAPDRASFKRRLARLAAKIGKPLARLPIIRKLFYRLIGSDYGRAPEHMRRTLHNMLESDVQFDPSRVRVARINLLWGKADKVTPLGMGRQLQRRLKGAQMQEFEEWQHAPYITHPEQLAEAIQEVLV